MINGLIGKKINMSTSFDDEKGLAIPVTVIKLGPCKVTQVKTRNVIIHIGCKTFISTKK